MGQWDEAHCQYTDAWSFSIGATNREQDTQCPCNLGTEKAEGGVCKFNARQGYIVRNYIKNQRKKEIRNKGKKEVDRKEEMEGRKEG